MSIHEKIDHGASLRKVASTLANDADLEADLELLRSTMEVYTTEEARVLLRALTLDNEALRFELDE